MSQSPRNEQAKTQVDAYLEGWQALETLLQQGKSFSGHERNCAFLNCGGAAAAFADVSAVTGLDFDDDGRGLATVDWDHDGDLDIWLTNRTAPRLRFMQNQIAAGRGDGPRFVALRLRGVDCNRDGIGARVVVAVEDGDGPLVQTLHAGDGFLSQSAKWLHFGLSRGDRIDRVTVHWPGGEAELFDGVQAGRRYTLEQGAGRAVQWQPPRRVVKLAASQQVIEKPSDAAVVRLPLAFPLPQLTFNELEGAAQREVTSNGRALLVNVWASWCVPCLGELSELAAQKEALAAAGVDVLALTVDGMDQEKATTPADAQRMLKRLRWPFDAGVATGELLEKLDIVQRFLLLRHPPLAVPTSFLLDPQLRLVAIYRGPVSVEDLLADVAAIDAPLQVRRDRSTPFTGRWYPVNLSVSLREAASPYKDRWPDDAMSYLQQELQVIEQTRSQVSDPGDQLDEQEAKTRKRIALMHAVAGQLPDAAEHFTRAAALQPDSAELHALLGKALMELGRRDEADQVLRHALALDARSAQAHAALGWLLMTKPDDDQAMQHLRTALQIDPGLVPPHDHLANILAKHGKFAQAAEHYRAALAEPSPQIHYKLAKVLTMTGGLDEALNHFRHALRTRPDWVAAMNGAAWILATHPSDKQRDAKQALRIAKEAATMTHYEDAPLLNTLAAAYAAAGEFKRAVATARAAIAIAEQDDDTAVAEQIRHYLQWYERGEPYRQEPAAGRDNSAQ